MSFSVGILYSAQEFTSFIHRNEVKVEEFRAIFGRFSLAKPEDILQVVTKCNWMDFHPDGICRVTQKGRRLLEGRQEEILRLQLFDVIDADRPTWAAKIPNGRQEAVRFFPIEVAQCFQEAGLMEDWDQHIIEWWDRLAMAFRSYKTTANLVTGRKAEFLSMQYEEQRTGFRPHWQSLESNFSGYDVLSRTGNSDDTLRKIEVKGSSLKKKEAFCFITRNEWETAKLSKDYHFHFWCLSGTPILLDIDKGEMAQHVPSDNGEGAWETTKIYFKDFRSTNSSLIG